MIFRRPDGRQITVHTTGPAGGPAVLVQHGMPGTGSVVTTAPAGVRLIGVDRPGYEQTTPAAPGFATAVEDALFVAELRAGEGHGRTCFGHWAEMLGALTGR